MDDRSPVTDKHTGDAPVLQERESLQQQIAVLSDQLRQAEENCRRQEQEHSRLMAKAEEASRAKIAFFANMSHEIRTPMNAITGFSQLMMGTDLTEKQRYYLQQVMDGSDRLLRLMNTLFDLSKLESGTFHLEQRPFVWSELMKRLEKSLSADAGQKGLSFEIVEDSPVPDGLIGDGGRIYQMLFHLVENGIKFTEQGFVRLRVGFVFAPHAVDHGALQVAVEDSGIGMDDPLRGRLFQPFMLGDDSLTRQKGGSGLGLAICSHLLSLMRGEITVSSSLGKGSLFQLTIPLTVQQATVEDVQGKTESLVGCRVLLVDDRAMNRQIAREVLSDWGLEVIEAENGMQAIERLQQQRYDLLLMDLLMPVMGGLEATRRIRALPEFATLPIVAMTGNSSASDRRECLDAGMDDVLVKPIDFDQLPRQLLAWLRGKSGEASASCGEMRSMADEHGDHGLPSLLPVISNNDRERALRALGGSALLYRQLLEHFSQEHGGSCAQIRQAILRGDRAEALRVAHTLKSSAGSLGAHALMADAAQVEHALREGKHPDPSLLAALDAACCRLIQVLSDLGYTGQTATEDQPPESLLAGEVLLAETRQLWELLDRGEERAIAVLDELLPSLRALDAVSVEKVRQLVDGFDFVAAAELLQQIIKMMASREGR